MELKAVMNILESVGLPVRQVRKATRSSEYIVELDAPAPPNWRISCSIPILCWWDKINITAA